MTTTDLVAWLRALLDEDARRVILWREIADDVARLHRSDDPPDEHEDMTPADRASFALNDAADRLHLDIAAKRRILDLHGSVWAVWEDREAGYGCPTCHQTHFGRIAPNGHCATLLALAQPHVGQPGWRTEWAT